jgi:hypothetical protein
MPVTLLQEGEDIDASLASVSLGPITEGSMLIAVVGSRGQQYGVELPAGFTTLGPILGPAFDGGKALLGYKVAGASEPYDFEASVATVGSVTLWVGEFDGIGAFVDSDSANNIAASSNLAAGPSSIGSGNLAAFCLFNQSARSLPVTGGVPPNYIFDGGWTREVNIGVNASGPCVAMAWREYADLADPVAVNATAVLSRGYGWLLATFVAGTVEPEITPVLRESIQIHVVG